MKTENKVIGKLLESNIKFQRLTYEISEKTTDLNLLIAEVQGNCSHEHLQNNYAEQMFYGDKRVDSKTCIDCGKFIPKPEGMPWQVCSHCWSEMVYDGTVYDGPGNMGEIRTNDYHCPNCGRKEIFT